MTVEDLEAEFASRGEVRGGALLLPASIAAELVRRARAERIAVLGIEGFRLEPDATRPDLGQILDLGGAGCRTNPWAEAEAFLEERAGAGLHFEVVLGEAVPGR